MVENSCKNQAFIRDANPSDAAKICDVLIRSVKEICAKDYDHDEAVIRDWCSNKDPEIVAQWISNPNNFCLVAELAPHGIVGAAMYSRAESLIHLCYLVPEALHQGIGSRLLNRLEAEAARLEHAIITLNSSITARGFYKRHGYIDSGEPVYWRSVKAFPMRKQLSSSTVL